MLEVIGGVFFFFLGTALGSFFNVVVTRGALKNSLRGRSYCISCDRTLEWYELVPAVSFIVLRGKCRTCNNPIPFQNLFAELLMGVLLLGSFLVTVPLLPYSISGFFAEFLYISFVVTVLFLIVLYDLRSKIIPDGLVFTFIGVTGVKLFVSFTPFVFSMPPLYDLLIGPVLALIFASLWFISGGRWIGLGDAKLVLGIGWFLGFFKGISAVLLAFWIGAAFGILLILFAKLSASYQLSLFGKPITMKTEVPFAPFLILGMLLVFFFSINVLPIS